MVQANGIRCAGHKTVHAQCRSHRRSEEETVSAQSRALHCFLTVAHFHSVFCRKAAYDKKQAKRVRDRLAVAAGTATQEQWNSVSAFICLKRAQLMLQIPHTSVQRQVTLTNRRDFNHLAAVLRSMKRFEPLSYALVSPFFLQCSLYFPPLLTSLYTGSRLL